MGGDNPVRSYEAVARQHNDRQLLGNTMTDSSQWQTVARQHNDRQLLDSLPAEQ